MHQQGKYDFTQMLVTRPANPVAVMRASHEKVHPGYSGLEALLQQRNMQ